MAGENNPEKARGGKAGGEKAGLTRPDLISVAGLAVALAGILGGLVMEGGRIKDVAQFTAAMIVLGGTSGAVMVSTPLHVLKGALRRLAAVFLDSTPDLSKITEEVIGYATKARKNGLVSLEKEAEEIADPFLRKAMNLGVDGTDLQEIRKMLELQIDIEEQTGEAEARGVRERGRVCADDRHYRRGAGADSSDEEPGEHRRSGARDRGGVRGDGVWSGVGEPAVPADGGEDQGAAAGGSATAGADSGRRVGDRGGTEPEADPGEAARVHGRRGRTGSGGGESGAGQGRQTGGGSGRSGAGSSGGGACGGIMARKKKRPEHENHERWLISYADFITLLFAFFVVMFATSQTDKGKAQQVSDSVKKALEGEKMSTMLAAILGGTVSDKGKGNAMMRGPGGAKKAIRRSRTTQKLAELVPSLKVLTEELKKEIESGRIQINMQPRGLVVSFTQAALFPSGEDVISPDAYEGLEKVAAAINKLPNPVRLEGHTDSVPIRTPRFHSNWELSSARSIALMEILTDRFGVPQERLSIAGYADTAPIASNDTRRRPRAQPARGHRGAERAGDDRRAGEGGEVREGRRRVGSVAHLLDCSQRRLDRSVVVDVEAEGEGRRRAGLVQRNVPAAKSNIRTPRERPVLRSRSPCRTGTQPSCRPCPRRVPTGLHTCPHNWRVQPWELVRRAEPREGAEQSKRAGSPHRFQRSGPHQSPRFFLPATGPYNGCSSGPRSRLPSSGRSPALAHARGDPTARPRGRLRLAFPGRRTSMGQLLETSIPLSRRTR